MPTRGAGEVCQSQFGHPQPHNRLAAAGPGDYRAPRRLLKGEGTEPTTSFLPGVYGAAGSPAELVIPDGGTNLDPVALVKGFAGPKLSIYMLRLKAPIV